MLLETAKVVAFDDDSVHLVATSNAGCERCNAGAGCAGLSLQNRSARVVILPRHLWHSISCNEALAPGAKTSLTLSEPAVLGLAWRFYLIPLCCLLLATAVASALGASEAIVMLAALLALTLGFQLLHLGVASRTIDQRI
jgi:positive regulator of sigma E activity